MVTTREYERLQLRRATALVVEQSQRRLLSPYGNTNDRGGQEDKTPPPSIVPALELPVYGVPPPDRKWILDVILRELNNGQFQNAGKLGDAILRDGRIRGAHEQRQAGLFSAPLMLEPANDSAKAAAVCDEIKTNWDKMFPRAKLEELHRYGIVQGIGLGQKVWDTSTTPWTFRLEPFHPQFYLWQWPVRNYHVITYDKGLVRVPERSTSWINFAPYGYSRGFLMALLHALVDPFCIRGWSKNDWAHWCEIHGRPIRMAIIPQEAKPSEEREFVRSVGNISGNTVIKSRQDKDGNKYSVELIEAMSMGWKGFEAAIKWSNGEIAGSFLGQQMSMDGQGGLNSQEKPGEAVRIDVKARDSMELSITLREQALKEYCEFNHGDPELAPKWPKDQPGFWAVIPPEDKAQNAATDLSKAQASQIRVAIGMSTPEEEAIARAEGLDIGETLDVEARKRIQKASIAALEQEAKNAHDDANDPAPTPGEQNRQQQEQPAKPPKPGVDD